MCNIDNEDIFLQFKEDCTSKYLWGLLQMLIPYPFFSFCPVYLSFLSFSHLQDWHGYVDGLKSFSNHHGYDGLMVLLSISDTVHHPRQQVAVYSNNADILNQVNQLQDHPRLLHLFINRCNSINNKGNRLTGIVISLFYESISLTPEI